MTDTRIITYVWAFTARHAFRFAVMKNIKVTRYATEADAHAAKVNGDDGFPGESLYRVTVDVEEVQE